MGRDIGMYPAQFWVPPVTVMTKPSLKGKKEVSDVEGEAGRQESRENKGMGWLGVQGFGHSYSVGFMWGNKNHSPGHIVSTYHEPGGARMLCRPFS